MSWFDIFRVIGILGPVVVLLGLGFWLTLGSGVVGFRTPRGVRQTRENFSRLVFEIMGWLVGLAALQQFLGPGFSLGW
jgi:hypothetical protein